MIAYVFPGQGSQAKGMGQGLFDEFSELTAQADKILGYSIKRLCIEDPGDQLGQTEFTQPALYVVNALSYLKKKKELGKKPDYVAGHSLGEYNALFVSGVFDFETGLKLVKKRGELMSLATGGGMAAVLGLGEEMVHEVIAYNNLQGLDVANFNTPTQIIISGAKDLIQRAKPVFESAGARSYVTLKVSGAFHSRYMQHAKESFEEYIEQYEFSKIQIPIISNVKARPYSQKEIKKILAEQITSSVKWTESIRYLMGKGVEEIIQVGPGNVLTGLVRTIQREAIPLTVADNEMEEDEPEWQMAPDILIKDAHEALDKTLNLTSRTEAGEMHTITRITAHSLGSSEFKKDYGIKYAYVTGSMYRGISSKEMVVKVGKAGLMGFYGSGGVEMDVLEETIQYIQRELSKGEAYGINLIHTPNKPEIEEKIVDLFIKYNVRNVEASAFMSMTPALVRYRLKGLSRDGEGRVVSKNRVIAKVSRPEVAEAFLSPAPEFIMNKLLVENKITSDEIQMAMKIPMADDLCVEADSGGHTDHGVAYALMPAMFKLRDEMMRKYKYGKQIRVGAAGGIGTPAAAAAAFMLGADFIVTGSINQSTIEAGTSDAVKDLLQQINVQDTEYASAGDMFEIGAKVQVLKKGVFFPARANKLYDLFRQYNSIDEIDSKVRRNLEEKYFKKSLENVYEEIKARHSPEEIDKAEKTPKHKMALIFKWYFNYSSRLALSGDQNNRVDYQIHCGPALGAFNQWVKGTPLENWRNRHVDEIGIKLMLETAQYLNERFKAMA